MTISSNNPSNNPIDPAFHAIEKPSRYLGGEFGMIVKDPASVAVSFVLAFPDIYEVGMSHIGSQILYSRLNTVEWIAAERTYALWADREAQIRETGEPLRTLETGRPLGEFDLVGFSLQYEMSYTNILNMLQLSGIPLRREDRTTDHPLIIVGGPCAFNSEPLADFIDLALIGDGELAVVEICAAVREAKEQSLSRSALMERLSTIEGVYIPAFFDVSYQDDGRIAAVTPLRPEYEKVRRAVLADLDAMPYPTEPVVPFRGAVHDRVAIEIARGCTRGCRFCQAGYLYRPVRERSPETILSITDETLKGSGYDEVSLLSLSTGDYCAIAPLLTRLMTRHAADHVAVSFPSLRVGSLTEELMEEIKKVRKTGFTLAPEAGTERMRQLINKGITEEDLLEATGNAFRLGWRVIKLYFMIGLPTETDEDILAIAELARRVKQTGKGTAGGADVTVSISTFIPKSHTPFQWEPQISREETIRRQNILKDELRRLKIKLKWHDPKISFLEGVFARGDRRLGRVLETALANGCSFDGWSDRFNWDGWMKTFEECGVDPLWYLRRRDLDEMLPWHHLDSLVGDDYFRKELEKAHALQPTKDCRTGSCTGCHICDFKEVLPRVYPGMQEGSPEMSAPTSEEERETRCRLRFRVAKTGPVVFVGHLDFMTAFQRGLRRAELPVCFSGGFHPYPKTSFSEALPLGMASEAEIVDVLFYETLDAATVMERLNRALPEGIAIRECWELPTKTTSPSASIATTTYRIDLTDELLPGLAEKVAETLAAEDIPVKKRVKGGKIRDINLRANIFDLALEGKALYLSIGVGSPLTAAKYLLPLDEDALRRLPVCKTAVRFHEPGSVDSTEGEE